MKWTTTNYKGERVTWYSEDIIEKIKEAAERFKDADREESEKLLCLENDMRDILYYIESEE